MIIKFDTEITKQEIYAQGNELVSILGQDTDFEGKRIYSLPKDNIKHVVTFNNPVLVTDNYRIGLLQNNLRDTVISLYASPNKTTEYDGTELEFVQANYPGVWGPSIDTILFAKFLNKQSLEGVKTAAEIGCGSGFLSKRVLELGKTIERMDIVDINQYAIQCASDHIIDERAQFVFGDALNALNGFRYDLIICNPPYIPRPNSINDNAYEGIGLLVHLLSNANDILNKDGRIITNISSLSESVLKKEVPNYEDKIKYLDQKYVPLKINAVTNNENWMNYLLKNKGLKADSHDGYDYWHTIKIVEIKAK